MFLEKTFSIKIELLFEIYILSIKIENIMISICVYNLNIV